MNMKIVEIQVFLKYSHHTHYIYPCMIKEVQKKYIIMFETYNFYDKKKDNGKKNTLLGVRKILPSFSLFDSRFKRHFNISDCFSFIYMYSVTGWYSCFENSTVY